MEVDEDGRDVDGEEEDEAGKGEEEEEDMPDDLNLDNAQEVRALRNGVESCVSSAKPTCNALLFFFFSNALGLFNLYGGMAIYLHTSSVIIIIIMIIIDLWSQPGYAQGRRCWY